MTNTPNNAQQAVARAKSHTTWQPNYCLNHVWDCYTSQTKSYGVPDAITAWSRTSTKKADRSIPAGVPVYWRSSKQPHGHVAISLGGGMVRSTDWPKQGQVGDVSLVQLERTWGLTFLGWGLDFCGDTIANVYPKPAPPSSPVLRRGSTGAVVRHLQAELLRVFPAYAGAISSNGGPNGIYGPATEGVVKEFQRRVGLRVDGVVGQTTWTKLAGFGIHPA